MRPVRGAGPAGGGLRSPLASWFADEAAAAHFALRWLGRASVVLSPRDEAWREIVPGFEECVAMAASGLPFQMVAARAYDRSGDPRRLRRALAAGATVYLPQVHQVLPRLMRLMVALRAAFLGPYRDECSFLFVVEGKSQPGMGLHHDGDVDSFWLQLEGRRTLTLGPRVAAGAPEDLDDRRAGHGRGWSTRDLEPGTLLYLPPRTPHRVVCRARSLAVSLTWGPADRREALEAVLASSRAPGAHDETAGRGGAASPAAFRALVGASLARARRAAREPLVLARARAAGLVGWDAVAGQVTELPPPSTTRLWTQVPVVTGPVDARRRRVPIWTPDGELWLPARAAPLAARLSVMPVIERRAVRDTRTLNLLIRRGLLAPHDLPLRVVPSHPRALDGWRFR